MNEFEASISVSSLETDIFPIFLIRTDKLTDRQTDRQGQVLSRVPQLKSFSWTDHSLQGTGPILWGPTLGSTAQM